MKAFTFIATGLTAATLATGAWAAGDGGSPTPTPTTKTCTDGMVWDKDKKKCVEASRGMFDDDTLYRAAREFAYAGQFDNAISMLELAADQSDPRILTYYGFAHRKAGRTQLGLSYYAKALDTDPNYNLARSYLGQALLLQGDTDGAREQLAEIVARGGKGSYAYTELNKALRTGYTY